VAEVSIEGIALFLAVVAFLIWAFVTEFVTPNWPIFLPILIFAIGFITYYRWSKKAADPPDYGSGGPH